MQNETGLLCPFCGAKPIISPTTTQPNGHQGAMHITHTADCYLTLLTGASTHAGSSEGWDTRAVEGSARQT